MAWTLLSLTQCPPGEFIYEQAFNGKTRKFRFSDIFTLSQQVNDFRVANGLPGATVDQALADIVSYNCTRLGNNPRWCYNTDKTAAQVLPKRRSGGCGTCGHGR